MLRRDAGAGLRCGSGRSVQRILRDGRRQHQRKQQHGERQRRRWRRGVKVAPIGHADRLRILIELGHAPAGARSLVLPSAGDCCAKLVTRRGGIHNAAVATPAVTVDYRLHERRSRRRRSGWQTSGGVVVDIASGQVLLVRTKREAREGRCGWTWPKGLLDAGEGPVFAAIREIGEEAGVHAEPLSRIAVFATKRALRHYFLLSKIRDGLPVGRETLEIRWVDWGRAKELLERKRDRRVWRAARRAFAAVQGENRATKASRAPVLFNNAPPKSAAPSK
ncbi:MAG: NUDIX domain-containing protein [Myxococcales bacterium]|nr:NUDIX domain-containing protein [Myxococcales bacterium]